MSTFGNFYKRPDVKSSMELKGIPTGFFIVYKSLLDMPTGTSFEVLCV